MEAKRVHNGGELSTGSEIPTAGFLQDQEHDSIGLTRYGFSPFQCKPTDGSDSPSASHQIKLNKQSIIMRPRLYFPLINSKPSSSANSAANKGKYNTDCYDDCKKFIPDAGSCLHLGGGGGTSIGAGRGVRGSGQPTFETHCLPSFLIIGAMKAGTGELMKALNRHSLLESGHGAGGKNEIHFFGSPAAVAVAAPHSDNHISHDTTAAMRLSPIDNTHTHTHTHTHTNTHSSVSREMRRNCPWVHYATSFPDNKEAYTFDKSPDILRIPESHAQIAAMLPNAKLLVLLRNPSTRAVSAFDHNCRHDRYIRLKKSLCLTNSKANDSVNSVIIGEKGTIVRLDWLIDGAKNVHYSPEQGQGQRQGQGQGNHKVFGASKSFSPFGNQRACLHSCSSEGDPCKDIKYSTIINTYSSTLPYPCNSQNVEDYYFGTSTGTGTGSGSDTIQKAQSPGIHAKAEIEHGYYADQLEGLFQHFPVSQVHVIFQENMLEDSVSTLNNVQKFLGIPPYQYTSDMFSSSAHGSKDSGGFGNAVEVGVGQFQEVLYKMGKMLKNLFSSNTSYAAADEKNGVEHASSSDSDSDSTTGSTTGSTASSSSKVLQESISSKTKEKFDRLYQTQNYNLKRLLERIREEGGNTEEGGHSDVVVPESWPLVD